MNWKYKINLVSEEVFEEITQQRHVEFPEELKALVREANAATPEKYNFMVGTDERVFGAVLSFNKDEKEADSIYTALEVVKDNNLIPFAIDPFGNYICFDLKEKQTVFWDHETGMVKTLNMNLEGFISHLY